MVGVDECSVGVGVPSFYQPGGESAAGDNQDILQADDGQCLRLGLTWLGWSCADCMTWRASGQHACECWSLKAMYTGLRLARGTDVVRLGLAEKAPGNGLREVG